MELAYMYLKLRNNEYSTLNGEYNFSNKYHIKYEENDENIELYITKNKNFIDGFYGKNIVGLTGIIGENGAGKTRLLNAIKDEIIGNGLLSRITLFNSFGKGLEKGKNNEVVIISIIENDNIIIYYDHHNIKNIKLNTSLKNVCKKSYRDEHDNYMNVYLQELDSYPCIYYSNTMNYNYEDLEERDYIYNISSNYLINKYDNYNVYKTQQVSNLYKFLNSEYAEKYLKKLSNRNSKKNHNSMIDITGENAVDITFSFNFHKSKADNEIKEIIKEVIKDDIELFDKINLAGGRLSKLEKNKNKKKKINGFSLSDMEIESYLHRLFRIKGVDFTLYNFYLYFKHIEEEELPIIKNEEIRMLNYYTNDLYEKYKDLNIHLLRRTNRDTDDLLESYNEMEKDYNNIKDNCNISDMQKKERLDLMKAFKAYLYEGQDIKVIYDALNKLENIIRISDKLLQEINKFKNELVRIFIENTNAMHLNYGEKINEDINEFIDNWKCFMKTLNEYDYSLFKTLTGDCEVIKNSFCDEDPFMILIQMFNYGKENLSNKNDSISISYIVGEDEEKINYFLSKISNFKYFSKMIQVKWRKFSSGEIAILNLFSRFYSVKQEDNFKKIQNSSLMILIDEIDLYFHPEWQRCIVEYLKEFLTDLFSNFKVQVIMTSHSPFIISDLPKDNIIFLKNVDGQYIVCDGSEFKQTFGANIHTLLTNSFFMENTIGEFANRKIKDVAKDLSEKSQDEILAVDGRKEEIEFVISNIGEFVIKRKLDTLYNKKFEHININNKIEELSIKVKKLEKIIKENGYSS